MTATRMDFVIYQGDGAVQVFTVLDKDGNAVDISSASEITFAARRSLADPVIVTKTKTGGAITFVGGGTTGQFQVALGSVDTTPLTGYYLYQCVVTMATLPSTTNIGRMQVGLAPAWTYSGNPADSAKDAVRWLLGDVISTDPQVYDPEILYSLNIRFSVYGAAASCARSLAGKLSRLVDTAQGELKTFYGQRAKAYLAMAAQYENQSTARGGATPYAGGISIADKMLQELDSDRVPPQYNIGMTDNWLPVAPSGNETGTNAPPSLMNQ